MNRPTLRAGFFLGALGLGLLGCQGAPKKADQAVKKPNPDDPTAWSSTAISKGDRDDDASSAAGSPRGILKSGRLPGTLSSEGADIERSLGVQ